MIRVGVIGLGFIGRAHLAGYSAARRAGLACELTAVCDADPGLAARLASDHALQAVGLDLQRVHRTRVPQELLARPDVDLVSICTYTETHADLAIAALRAGKHVLVEKPLALTAAEVQRVAEAARQTQRVCMPAMCVRYWPGWDWLHARITDGSLGAVRSATFQRLAAAPAWGQAFFADFARSGGALADLHIHDADFVHWCFGPPSGVFSSGSLAHVTSAYCYDDGPRHVVAEGAWDYAPGFEFRARYLVAFEQATADFDSSRSEPLRLIRDGRITPIAIAAENGWELEIRDLLQALCAGRRPTRVTIDDALNTARLIDTERRSLQSGQRERFGPGG